MTPFAAWVRRRLEKALGRFEEGAEAPARIREQAIAFANVMRKSTRKEWAEFAADYAEECYRSGYLRGVEWAERDPAPAAGTRPSPEEIADAVDPTWRDRPWRPGIELDAPEEMVSEERSPLDAIREQVAAFQPKPRRF